MAQKGGVDPITISVIQHRIEVILLEVGEVMLRTSFSQILNTAHDFSTAICDPEGDIVAQAEHVPIHAGGLPWAVKSVADRFRGSVRPGDIFLLNDPYHGGNHLPDVTVFAPIFVDGRLVFWVINRSHQSDIGGGAHGGYNANATEIWQEGLRITPIRIADEGVLRDDLMDLLAANVRHSSDFRGDLAAMIGSARIGEQRVRALIEEYGTQTLLAAVSTILDGSERETRACIAKWKDGVFFGESVLEDDGHNRTNIHIRAKVTKKGSELIVDLSETDPQTTGFVNSSYANTRSAVVMALAFLIDPTTPKNAGTVRPLTVIAKQGTVVWPNPPAPTTFCTAHSGQDIAEAIVKAVAGACPERAFSGWGRRFRIALQGTDPRSGRSFIWHMFQARPGGGASSAGDGWPSGGEMQSAGSVHFGSIETTEVRFPLFFRSHEFRPDSMGDGRYRGGAGAEMLLEMKTDRPAFANTAGEGIRERPYGLFGAGDGLPHAYSVIAADGFERLLAPKLAHVKIDAGDTFSIRSSGGGGWGDPAERSQQARARDLADGIVSQEQSAARSG
jgi:N-methylhydantoinase B